MKVKCLECNYEWETKSKMVKVSCSSCGAKIKLRDKVKKEPRG